MSLIHNERIKLTATFLNGVAIAVIAVGGLAPMFTAFGVAEGRSPLVVSLQVLICLLTGLILHLSARMFLKRLRP